MKTAFHGIIIPYKRGIIHAYKRQRIRLFEQVGPLLNTSYKLYDIAKASLVNFAPENVDVDWIISETDKCGSWTDRNPL